MSHKPSYEELEQRIADQEMQKKASNSALKEFDSYMSGLHETAMGILKELDLATLLKNILQKAANLIGTDDGYIFLYEQEKNELVIKYGIGRFENKIGFRLKPGEGLSGKVWQSGKPLKVDEYDVWKGRHPTPDWNGMGFDLGIPLKSGDELIGVIGLCSYEKAKKVGRNEELILSRFAELASIALDNANLHIRLRQELNQKIKSENALRASEEKYRRIFENSVVGFFQSTLEGRFIQVNDAFAKMLGYESPEDLITSISDIATQTYVNPEDRREYQQVLKEQGYVESYECRALCKNGSQISVSVSTRAYFDPNIKADCYEGFVVDITQRKRAEEALQLSEEKFSKAFKASPVWVSITTVKEGRFLEVNDTFTKITGFTRAEAIAHTSFDLNFWLDPQKDRARVLEIFHRQGFFRNLEMKMRFKDGRIHNMLWSADPLVLGDEECLINVLIDITEFKQLREDKAKLESQLMHAQKMEAIGTLAGGIAHDFNNILSAIVGFTELALGKTSKNDPRHVDLQEVFRAGLRARDLVKQILTFSRQAEQDLQPVQVNLIVKEALKFLRSSLPSSIKIRPNIVSDVRVLADPTHIHQVMMNLCTNAKHAMLETGGVLEVSLSDVQLNADFVATHPGVIACPHLKLTVADSGDGMSAEVREKIFDPFFTTKGKEEGTGLGLAVVHGIVKSCGGFITVSSEPGKGSAFHVFLPAIESQDEPQAEFNGPLPAGSERVLFVDDEKLLVDIGKQMLERYGYRVTPRTSSIEALELFKAKPDEFDLVITDMTMPNMSGLELASEIISLRPELPIILCTGFSERITAARTEAVGIKALMLKPVSLDDMIRTARMVLDESR